MITLLKVIAESIAQAFQELRGNKLRSFLSLLGITIGIFCIIGVQSAVDSLQANIQQSFDKLGDDVIYVQKMPWAEDPHNNFWKYMRRPNPSYEDFEAIKKKVKSASLADYHIFVGVKSAKYRSNSVNRVFCVGVTYDCSELFNMEFEKGRYYSPTEYHHGMGKIVIGHTVAEELFGQIDPIGKKITLMGHKLEVIGVIKESGESIVNVLDWDEAVVLSYELARKIANVKATNMFGTTVVAKAAPGVSVKLLKDELTATLRAQRKLRPKEKENFALNQLSIITKGLESVFSVFDMVGLTVGIFAILVGGFSVANIMFVSVKERTNIIGIKKALGAKRHIILLEFLIESIILCLIGGFIGLAFIYTVAHFLSQALPFEIFLSFQNIMSGMIWSIAIGVIAGLIPAMQASKMDPVEAIRK